MPTMLHGVAGITVSGRAVTLPCTIHRLRVPDKPSAAPAPEAPGVSRRLDCIATLSGNGVLGKPVAVQSESKRKPLYPLND